MYRQQAAGAEIIKKGPPICPTCGVIAPTQASACAVCKQPYKYPRMSAPDHDDGSYWVAVRCSFQCRFCQFLSPLDELDIDGTVECARCHSEQRFDTDAWHQALAFAHAVGDLAFPPPEGRHPNPLVWIGSDNPHIRIGYTEVFGELRQSSSAVQQGMTIHRSLFIQAAPGYPVCRKCTGPLRIARKGERTNARCDECGEQTSYALPQGADRFGKALTGVVASDHRVDKPRARYLTQAGVVTLKCGECGGALPISKDRVVTCTYCSATCVIPARARPKDQGGEIIPEIWWLSFRGPSAQRVSLESPSEPSTGLQKYVGGTTHLEKAPEKKVTNVKQLVLNIMLPLLALFVGYVIAMMLGLHKLGI